MNGAMTPQPATPQQRRYTATRLPGNERPTRSKNRGGIEPRQSFATCSNGFLPLTRILRTGQSGLPSRTSNPRVRTESLLRPWAHHSCERRSLARRWPSLAPAASRVHQPMQRQASISKGLIVRHIAEVQRPQRWSTRNRGTQPHDSARRPARISGRSAQGLFWPSMAAFSGTLRVTAPAKFLAGGVTFGLAVGGRSTGSLQSRCSHRSGFPFDIWLRTSTRYWARASAQNPGRCR
jgi:hypothetical protein